MLSVRLSQFEGPLDLLLHLISKSKIDIKDIFVSHITQQYLESIADLSELDMSAASEFLAMAAMLIEIKSKAMLPKQPRAEDEDQLSEQDIIDRLYDYRRIKEAAVGMKQLEAVALRSYLKLPEQFVLPPPPYEFTNLTLPDLYDAMIAMLNRSVEDEVDSIEMRAINRDVFTVSDCMKRISKRLKKGAFYFTELFERESMREEVITVFIALLEMLKQNRARVTQCGIYEDLWIMPARTYNQKSE